MTAAHTHPCEPVSAALSPVLLFLSPAPPPGQADQISFGVLLEGLLLSGYRRIRCLFDLLPRFSEASETPRLPQVPGEVPA